MPTRKRHKNKAQNKTKEIRNELETSSCNGTTRRGEQPETRTSAAAGPGSGTGELGSAAQPPTTTHQTSSCPLEED